MRVQVKRELRRGALIERRFFSLLNLGVLQIWPGWRPSSRVCNITDANWAGKVVPLLAFGLWSSDFDFPGDPAGCRLRTGRVDREGCPALQRLKHKTPRSRRCLPFPVPLRRMNLPPL